MAMDRNGFENKLSEFLTGACGEYMAARLAKAMGWPDARYVGKWMREVDRLLDIELKKFYNDQKTKSSFNRKKLFDKCLMETIDRPFAQFTTAASSLRSIAEKYKLPFKIKKTDFDPEVWLEEFADRAREAIKK